jgi:diguanylate cyclase (GGDEF)-like protein
MRFGPKQRTPETSQLLHELGLARHDVSASALAALERLAAQRDEFAARLAAAEELADRDPLVHVLNRRAFLRELHRTMSEVERYKTPAAVLYIDLDGFKALNDGYGHAAGDAVLTHVGRLLIGRLGGDEFGVILNRVGADEARAKAQHLNRQVNSSAIIHAGVAHRIAASVGVHAIAVVEDPERAIARADEAMYADKHARKIEQQAFSSF